MPDAQSPSNDLPRLVIGAMSGTSCDGVDAALIETRGRGDGMSAKYRHHVERPFDDEFRRTLLKLREDQAASFADLAEVGRTLTLAYAAAVKDLLAEADVKADDVAAVAAHGQTLYHDPPNTIQWLDPSLLAFETGLIVVSDFRRADCAAGGQGAPLVPFGDWVFFRSPTQTRVILNLGGIANLTYLPAGGGIDDVIAFDTGPGCCILDDLVRASDLLLSHDVDGQVSADGLGILPMIQLIEQPTLSPECGDWMRFSHQPLPKSTDVPAMRRCWAGLIRGARFAQPSEGWPLKDLMATAIEFTTAAICQSVWSTCALKDNEVGILYVAGGGARNPTLFRQIRAGLSSDGLPTGDVVVASPKSPDGHERHYEDRINDWRVKHLDDLGLPSQAREAACFAVLGAATLDGEPSNVPSATGASRRVVLGSITPR